MKMDRHRSPLPGYPSLDEIIRNGMPSVRGILVPPDLIAKERMPRRRIPSDLPRDLWPEPPVLLLPSSAAPKAKDMLFVSPTAADLDLPLPTLDDAVELISEVPFDSAMLVLSIMAGELYHRGRDGGRQLALARKLYGGGPLLAKLEDWLAEDETRLAFDPRHVAALQRLVIAHAAPADPSTDLGPADRARLVGALIAIADSLPHGDPPEPELDSNPDWTAWAAYTVQVGAWHDDPGFYDGFARAHSRYIDVHRSSAVAEHAARCDIETWMVKHYNLTIAQQIAGGLACAVVAGALEPDLGIEARMRPIGPGFLANGALADQEADIVRLISATRAELRSLILARGDDPMRLAWDHIAFEQRPFLRDDDGRMWLISPKGLVSWMTRGLHHRALQAAEREPHPTRPGKTMTGRLLTYSGALGEESVRRLVAGTYAPFEQAGGVRVLDERTYRVGKKRHRTPDIALDFGEDLVLIEVYSGRISLEARAGGEGELLRKAIDQATTAKLTELANRTSELLAGHELYPDLDLSKVRKIWPILVLAGDSIMQTEVLWGHLRTAAGAILQDDRVQRPVIADLDDFEPLLGLVEGEGRLLPELLADFLASQYAERPPRNWIDDAFGGIPRRPTYVDQQFFKATHLAASSIYPNSPRLADLRHAP